MTAAAADKPSSSMDSPLPQQENGCSPWLCMESSPLTACFFASPPDATIDEKAVANSKSDDENILNAISDSKSDDDIVNVMDIDNILYEDNVEVSLDDYFLDVQDDEDAQPLNKEEAELRFEERMAIARQIQLQRYLRRQRDAQANMAARAKEQRRRVSQKNADERKKNQDLESADGRREANLDAAIAANASLVAPRARVEKPETFDKRDGAQNANKENEDVLQETNQHGKDSSKSAAPTDEEPPMVADRKYQSDELKEAERLDTQPQEEMLPQADKRRQDEESSANQLTTQKSDEEIRQATKKQHGEKDMTQVELAKEEKKEDETDRKVAQEKEERRLARQKAAEAEERMKKAREEQRKLHQQQHQEGIRKRTEEAKKARRLAAQEKRERQKRATEEEKATRLSEEKAEAQRRRQQLESTKQQRAAWEAQQAASTAAHREQWQKTWHAKHDAQHAVNASYPSSPRPTVHTWNPRTSPRPNVKGAPWLHYQPRTGTPTSTAPPCPQWQGSHTTPKSPPTTPQQPPASPRPVPAHQPYPTTMPSTPTSVRSTMSTDSGIVNDESQQEKFTRIKRDVLTSWALRPPAFQILRPVNELVMSIHTVFPSKHEYFVKWHPIAGVSNEVVLKKSVRKIRFFLHPDKLPKDLSEEQLFLCKLLWDVTNDAWEEHTKATEELSWVK